MQKERQYLCFCGVDLNTGAHVGCFITQLCCHSTLFTPLCAWEPPPLPPLTLHMFYNEITFCALMIELSSFHLPAKLLRFHASMIFPWHIVCRRTGTSLSSPCIYIHSGSKFCFSKSRLLVTFNCRKIKISDLCQNFICQLYFSLTKVYKMLTAWSTNTPQKQKH